MNGSISTPEWELVSRLVVAALLGSLIGVERERVAWAAGLRTHMLVSVGACLVMIVSAFGFGGVLGPNIVLDPSRVAAQVVSGIGFLGAGTILLRGDIVRGLTTAASLWAVAAVGLAIGGGLYVPATAATLIMLAILTVLKPVEEWFQHRNISHELTLSADRHGVSIDTLNEALGYRARRITRFVCSPNADGSDEIRVRFERISTPELLHIATQLEAIPLVHKVVRTDAPNS